ncbi:hypothetical protein TCAL_06945 [Tigriopus californicus]|uniref:Uncharacterized protein n=1 Tax=Tigriopus californicus TaxID=6832 RepID=A0A553NVG0_TIGCA|nr:uncharacterized protein LOC131888906 [Tigriopus californicus]XP_059093848.1 uncharacterized protein LOC131888906 [Tigriopus californicus]XP_059093857.1 uncharacterized protein LOC131888906 [Tigriopus californicus]TRY69415.1 hypothetical protein TCAL_06945 [Tigriopus californicus]|eukprot:TCALIF_06945-PA protein Name:"Protein of unknown function" AED:0.00 eAED:0.00 QI:217/1/1/1/0.8/0.66/6/134/309
METQRGISLDSIEGSFNLTEHLEDEAPFNALWNIGDTLPDANSASPYELVQHPSSKKKVLQYNTNTQRVEVVRNQIVLLRRNSPSVTTNDTLTISLRHSDLQYTRIPITACEKHRNPKHDHCPFEVVDCAIDPCYRKDESGHYSVEILNMNAVHEIQIRFLCFSSEPHNSGNKEMARNWMLQLEGTLMMTIGRFPPLQLQVVVCLRDTNRLRKSRNDSNLRANESAYLRSSSGSSGSGFENAKRKRSHPNEDGDCERETLEDQYLSLKMEQIKADLPSLPTAVLQWKVSKLKMSRGTLSSNMEEDSSLL